MSRVRVINFALLGYGKLGSGFYENFLKKKDKIKSKTGYEFNLAKVLVKNRHFKRKGRIDKALFTTDINDILNDDSIKIAIDVIGGIEPTFTIIKKILKNGIHLISANRTLLAAKMHELSEIATEHNTLVMPDSSIGGSLPIISTLQRDLLAAEIKSLTGILSGTSNYILSEMSAKEISLQDVLKEPEVQKMGESLYPQLLVLVIL